MNTSSMSHLNVGFRTRISGETDFPCIFGERVGLGRSYVKIDDLLTYDRWVDGIQRGRSYVTDGKSHLLDFRVNEQSVGVNDGELHLGAPSRVRVSGRIAARLDPVANASMRGLPLTKRPFWDLERARVGDSREVPVEVIVNGRTAATQTIVADGKLHDFSIDVRMDTSSWIALRILPSSHTNPIFIIVGNKPIRASRLSAEWCLAGVDQCWSQKAPNISARERGDAEEAYEHARQVYRQRLAESERE
jgi:hypothetical protein